MGPGIDDLRHDVCQSEHWDVREQACVVRSADNGGRWARGEDVRRGYS